MSGPWGSVSEFFAMGGHGFYIWGSYIVTAVFLLGEVFLVRKRKKAIEKRIARMSRLNEKVDTDESS